MAEKRPLIILHGWSDNGSSFDRLARHLAEALVGVEIQRVSIGDYLSMHDDLRFDDLQEGLERAWTDRNLPRSAGSVDVIVHSTSGLIVRDWLQRRFPPHRSPIKHLVMLAPANFGSPLAHKGRSMFGRVLKGFVGREEGQKLLSTGAEILRGLELASPFSWELARRDRFGSGSGRFAPGRTLCTVLVGNTGYRGIRSVANEDGGDGTVRISTANLNCSYLKIAFFAKDTERANQESRTIVPEILEQQASSGRAAFRILDGIDHSSIKLDAAPSRLSRVQKDTLEWIRRALTVDDEGFPAFCDECDRANATLTRSAEHPRAKPGYQNTVVRVRDQFDAPVTDYLIEFYHPEKRDGGVLASRIHEQAIRNVHAYRGDRSLRSLYLDTQRFMTLLRQARTPLGFSITAHPILGVASTVAGFSTFADEDIEDLLLTPERVADFLQPHRTLLLDIIVQRRQSTSVFQLRDASD